MSSMTSRRRPGSSQQYVGTRPCVKRPHRAGPHRAGPHRAVLWALAALTVLQTGPLGVSAVGASHQTSPAGASPQHTVLGGGRPDEGGQPPPKCMYSFVVNELDSAKCPLLLQHMYGYQREQSAYRGHPHHRRPHPDTANQYNDLAKRVADVEQKVFQELRAKDDVAKDLEEQETLLKSTQINLLRQKSNITQVNFVKSNITRVNFVKSYMTRVNFVKSYMTRVNFVKSNITQVNFVKSNSHR